MTEQDAAGIELHRRLDAIERRFESLRRELDEVRTNAMTLSAEAPPVEARAPVERLAEPRLSASAERSGPAAVTRSGPPVVRPPASSASSLRDLVDRSQLVGPRGFAIVGGAVTALGIGLLFVLATNRGWIGPTERVILGAVASTVVFAAGLVVRARFGHLLAALAAVGAGAAGAYATLAAATARYDLVPDAFALPLAAAIAAATTAVAVAWRSQILAGIGLIGSALAPALQSLDTGMTPGSAAFAVVVLAATTVVSFRRRWEPLVATVAAVVVVQTLVLVADRDWAGDRAAVAVGIALAVTLLGTGMLLRLGRAAEPLPPLAATSTLVGVGVALVTAASLLENGTDRGVILLAVAGIWAGAWLVLQPRDRELALVVGVSSLALAGAATAELLSDDALTISWAAQAVLLSVVAARLQDARLAACGLVYVVLAAGHVLAVDAPPSMLFDPSRADAAPSVAVAAAALAALVWGLAVRPSYAPTTETGVLAFLANVRRFLEARRAGLQEAVLFGGGTLGVFAAAVLTTGVSFEAGHVASTGAAAAAAAAAVAVGARRRSTGLIVASLAALAVVLAESGFDADEFFREGEGSTGGWSMLEAAVGLLGGGYALRLLHPSARRLGIVSGIAASVALVWSTSGLALVVPRVDGDEPSQAWLGVGLLVVALGYAALSAAVFGTPRLRNLSTTMWAHAAVAALAAEAFLLLDARWFAAVAAVSGGLLALAALPLREPRLAIGGAIVTGLTTLGTLGLVTSPDHFLEANAAPADGLWVLVACVAGTAAVGVALAAEGRRVRRGAVLTVAALTLYAVSLGVLGLVGVVSSASLEADFERGHTVVSALWALVGLVGLVAGLARNSAALRVVGLGLFGVSLAKIFLYDLSELSSVARAASFIAVGGAILAGGAVLQKLSARLDDTRETPGPAL